MNDWHFIDNVDLVIHEAGHVVFLFFGTFLYIAGGSLLQLIMPALFVVYFYYSQQFFSSSLVMYWLAINFFNVARYAADAQVMQLELLGGDNSGHDWHNLLSMAGLLDHVKFISGAIYTLGVVMACLGFILGFMALQREGENML